MENVVQLQLRISSGPGQTQPMLRALRSLMLPAQLDSGCTGCWLYVDAMNSRSLCYVEEWAGPIDLEREMHSARFTRLLSVMEGAPQRPSLDFRFISQTRGLDYVEEVRLFGGDGQRISRG
jgi:quinol monooxygenase YgiN